MPYTADSSLLTLLASVQDILAAGLDRPERQEHIMARLADVEREALPQMLSSITDASAIPPASDETRPAL